VSVDEAGGCGVMVALDDRSCDDGDWVYGWRPRGCGSDWCGDWWCSACQTYVACRRCHATNPRHREEVASLIQRRAKARQVGGSVP